MPNPSLIYCPHAPKLPTGLTPIQRILSMTDGTVTDILSAYRQEPIALIKLEATAIPKARIKQELPTQVNETYSFRRIILRGEYSKKDLVLATSVLIPERLPQGLQDKLMHSNLPIGQIIQDTQTETFREILNIARCEPTETNKAFIFQRSYRIFIHNKPCILIEEKFSKVI